MLFCQRSVLAFALGLLTSTSTVCAVLSSSRADRVDEGLHARGHSHGNSGRTHGNFGPSVRHQKFKHGVSPEQPFVTPLTATPVEGSRLEAAVKYASDETGVPLADIRISSEHTSDHNGVTHVYLQQYADGLEIVNGVGNVNLDRSGQVISFGDSFYKNTVKLLSQDATGQLYTADTSGQIVLSYNPPSVAEHLQLGPLEAVQAVTKLLNIEFDDALLQEAPIDQFAPGSGQVPSFVISGASFAERDIPARLKWIQESDGQHLKLVWDLEIEMQDNWYNAFVDTVQGEVVQLIDWVSDASYNIFPLGTNDPHSGDRVLVKDPAHPVASPMGWHNQGSGGKHTVTIGNNVYAHENLAGSSRWVDNHRPDGTSSLTFDFPINFEKSPSTYVDAAITNLFYWNNAIHDLLYMYGFDEKAGNFQHDNVERGGKGNDAVIANAQDGSGYNNANFATPRDGQQPRMRMYVWDVTDPFRDGDLEGGIVMHEYCHGLSTRLTGGPENVGCLGWGESGGMGEGWGDFFATVTRTTSTSTRQDDFGMGEYANGGHGIRRYLYSTNMTTNPSTYAYIDKPGYWGVHAKGEVWAEILYEVYWNLVDEHGFDPDWFNTGLKVKDAAIPSQYRDFKTGQMLPRPRTSSANKTPKKAGNIIALQLVVDGMKLQPCNPTFVDARDAILQADEVNNKGENLCAIWKGFAKRGLGVAAVSGGREDFGVPKGCDSK
ncbi:Fungalysin metallopeptidase-domain-containing protein [Fimicolochytrium jonesii]|uniref:Fungalysin metallopeptidase-domain-containing protein n=1 Tax=Fimicolochytrium jonesii TaxID=1396493 RepID=UPI0022FE3FDD|nr:Fungalysin metallopeptidase-domain-containing protein [Fimicolochytrium jonesii]KAI8817568.1 Fungalysin metallopeptidase-domain-containing protein [Fimicolochytrium jonesii]